MILLHLFPPIVFLMGINKCWQTTPNIWWFLSHPSQHVTTGSVECSFFWCGNHQKTCGKSASQSIRKLHHHFQAVAPKKGTSTWINKNTHQTSLLFHLFQRNMTTYGHPKKSSHTVFIYFSQYFCFVMFCSKKSVFCHQLRPTAFSNNAWPMGPDVVTDAAAVAVAAQATALAAAPFSERRGARASSARAKRAGKVARMADIVWLVSYGFFGCWKLDDRFLVVGSWKVILIEFWFWGIPRKSLDCVILDTRDVDVEFTKWWGFHWTLQVTFVC